MKKTSHTVVFGDARHMSLVEDRSVQLVVTSPPYWQLKDYGSGNQIGFDDSYEDYINNLNLVWQECHRVLSDGCRLCVNIGDQFARSVYYGRYKVIPIRTEIVRFCETIGFDFMGSIIWQKVTTCNTSGGAVIMGSYPFPRNGIVKIDYEHILLFKKHGTAPKVSPEIKAASELTKEEWNEYFYGHWNFPGEKQNGHLAMYPEELPHRLIKMFSFVGERVLDPFLGSGTTTLAARKLGRNSIGYEINREFEGNIREKLGEDGLFHDVEFATDESEVDKDALNRLPYLFVDPLKLDKQADPRKLKFGSRIAEADIRGERTKARKKAKAKA
jgi:DNA modification methylase